MLQAMTNPTTQRKGNWVTPREASQITGLTPAGLAKMADQERLTAVRPGGTHRRYVRAEVEALVAPSNNAGGKQ